MPDSLESLPASSQSHIISRVLSPAVRLWLQSQVEGVDELHCQIEGGDRQFLSGHIAQVSISASHVVYQGLHLSQICLTGTDIHINLGQILRGKPFRLLHIVPVRGEVRLQQTELNASLQTPLLANVLTEFLTTLLQSMPDSPSGAEDAEPVLNLQNPQIFISPGQIILSTELVGAGGDRTPVIIRTGLVLSNSHTLQLDQPYWLPHPTAKRGLALEDWHGFQFDLGTDVDLDALLLDDGHLICRGTINVIPA